MIKNRSNGITDAGAPLVVDAFTRKVTVPATERVIGVVGDHSSEQVRFSLPRHIDNHDMTTCTESYVAWRNVDGEEGTDELIITETTDDRILFGWVVRDAITTAKGLVSFSLHFECWEKDEKTGKEKLVYKWGTHTCSECEILDAINTRKGDYKAIYIDGDTLDTLDTLVFADYTPVHDNTLDLTSCVVPEGTKEINEAGKHDVGNYAYVDVEAAYEEPTITIADGVVTAEANGRAATHDLGMSMHISVSNLISDEYVYLTWVGLNSQGCITTESTALEPSEAVQFHTFPGTALKLNCDCNTIIRSVDDKFIAEGGYGERLGAGVYSGAPSDIFYTRLLMLVSSLPVSDDGAIKIEVKEKK